MTADYVSENLRWWTVGKDGRRFPGTRRYLQLANVTPGASWRFTVPGGVCWRLLFGQVDAALSAAVGNRRFAVAYEPSRPGAMSGGEAMWRGWRIFANPPNDHPAFSISSGEFHGPTNDTNSEQGIVCPSVWLETGWSIASFETGFDAADQYTLVRIAVDEIDLPMSMYTGSEHSLR